MLKISLTVEITDAPDRETVAYILEHVKEGIEGGFYHGGYDWATADYNWSIEEEETTDEEDETDDE